MRKTDTFIPFLNLALVGGLSGFFVFWFSPGLIWLLIIGAVGLVCFGLWFVLPRFKSKQMEIEMETAGVSQAALEKALEEGSRKLKILKELTGKITTPRVKENAAGICKVVKEILVDIKEDPKDLKAARQFFNYYLDATIKILTQYTELSARKDVSKEVKTTLEKAEKLLGVIKSEFEKQLSKLLEDNVLDLDTELEVLKKTIQMEGFNYDEM